MPTPFHHLPPFSLGPYTLRVASTVPARMRDQRVHVDVDWNEGVVHLKEGLSPAQALNAVLRVVVAAAHYRSGLNDVSNEESFTHSLASGLVELAGSSPQFWFELHLLLDAHFEHPDLWAPAAGGAAHSRPAEPLPTRVRFGRQVCELQWLGEKEWPIPGTFGLYSVGAGVIELRKSLKGNNRALVVLHELLHFMHDCQGLADHDSEQDFCRGQVGGLLRLWEQNPEFWAWWLHQVGAGARLGWRAGAR